MHLQQVVCFELAPGCPHAPDHPFCPASRDRWAGIDTSAPMTDEQIVETACRLIGEFHFRGLIAWHFYNEPMATPARMLGLIRQIKERQPGARFLLWTHIAHAPETEPYRGLFDQVRLSMYEDVPADIALAKLRAASRMGVDPQPMFPVDDGRVSEETHRARCVCLRPWGEMIFDFYGHLHACCYDWRGEIKIGHIGQPLEELVARWRALRLSLVSPNPPVRCRRCRGYPLPRFAESVQLEAFAAIQNYLQHGTELPACPAAGG